jgi:hypothetical protein
MSHQVGLVWSGGNGWDDLMREQVNLISIYLQPQKIKLELFSLFRSASRRSASVWAVEEIQQLKFQDNHPQALHHRPTETVDEAHSPNSLTF